MAGVAITDGSVTITLNGDVMIQHQQRRPLMPRPGAAGSEIQGLGRKSRQLMIRNGTLYSGTAITDITRAAQLSAWCENATVVTVTTLLETLSCRIRMLRIIEGGGKRGIEFDMDISEAFPSGTSAGGGAGVASQAVASSEVTTL